MKTATKLNADFRLTIPKEVRESQGWLPGQKLEFVETGAGYQLVPIATGNAPSPIRKSAGSKK